MAKILSHLPLSEYSVINDITLQIGCNSVQIDHLVLSLYGIFVIETKNYSGWIMGSKNSDQWIKNVYGKKYYFYNPIRQNNAHIYALSKILACPKENFISLIAFSDKAQLKVHTENNVIYFKEILHSIRSYSEKIFSLSEIEQMKNTLLIFQVNTLEEKKTHLSYVQYKKASSKSALEQMICPDCGGKLVIKNGKYGSFIGCANYPKCKYFHPL